MLINFIERKSSNSLITFGNNMRIEGKNNGFATTLTLLFIEKSTTINRNHFSNGFFFHFVFIFSQSILLNSQCSVWLLKVVHHQQCNLSNQPRLLCCLIMHVTLETLNGIHFNDFQEFRQEVSFEIVYCVPD